MVCTANICRSPIAMVVGKQLAANMGKASAWKFEAAGTHAARQPQPTDARALAVLKKRGYKAQRGRSRRITDKDFAAFDLILAMDAENLDALQKQCPSEHQHKLLLLLTFAPEAEPTEVPDPYFGNTAGFERVLDLCEAGVRGLLDSNSD